MMPEKFGFWYIRIPPPPILILMRSYGYICICNLDFFISWAMIFGMCIDY